MTIAPCSPHRTFAAGDASAFVTLGRTESASLASAVLADESRCAAHAPTAVFLCAPDTGLDVLVKALDAAAASAPARAAGAGNGSGAGAAAAVDESPSVPARVVFAVPALSLRRADGPACVLGGVTEGVRVVFGAASASRVTFHAALAGGTTLSSGLLPLVHTSGDAVRAKSLLSHVPLRLLWLRDVDAGSRSGGGGGVGDAAQACGALVLDERAVRGLVAFDAPLADSKAGGCGVEAATAVALASSDDRAASGGECLIEVVDALVGDCSASELVSVGGGAGRLPLLMLDAQSRVRRLARAALDGAADAAEGGARLPSGLHVLTGRFAFARIEQEAVVIEVLRVDRAGALPVCSACQWPVSAVRTGVLQGHASFACERCGASGPIQQHARCCVLRVSTAFAPPPGDDVLGVAAAGSSLGRASASPGARASDAADARSRVRIVPVFVGAQQLAALLASAKARQPEQLVSANVHVRGALWRRTAEEGACAVLAEHITCVSRGARPGPSVWIDAPDASATARVPRARKRA